MSASFGFNQDFTLSVWVNIHDGLPVYWVHNLISNGGDQYGANFRVISDASVSPEADYLQFGLSNFASNLFFGVNAFVPPLRDTWWQAVVVRSGTSVSMFRNGILVTNGTMAGAVPSFPTIWFGQMQSNYSFGTFSYYSLVGGINDVRMYNRSLSASQVQQLYAYESQAHPPSITSQPQPVTVNAKNAVAFSVTAIGAAPLSYQWSLNSTNIAGATNSSLTIFKVAQQNLGAYAVVVTNAFGSVTSSNAVLSMYPFIASPFAGAITYWGSNATFDVGAWGTGPLSYQWFDNGVAIQDATDETFVLTNIQATNAGFYSVVVTSQLGSVTNTPEQVVVEPAGVSLIFNPALKISGVVGQTYIIQSAPNLANSNAWVTLTNLTLTQGMEIWVDTSVDASSPFNPTYFYQVLPGQ